MQSKPEKWYLKTPEGKIQGPFSISKLNEMAIKGEIIPGSQVSTNSISWQPVETLSELHMEWIAELPDGKIYGPFHVLAVPVLYKNGYLPPNTILKNRFTKKTLHLNEILEESPEPQVQSQTVMSPPLPVTEEDKIPYEQLKKQLDETLQKLQEEASERNILETQSKHIQQKLRAEIEQLTNELSSLKLHLRTTAENLAEEKKRNKQLAEEASNKEAKLHEQIQQLEIMLESANANTRQWKEQVDIWKTKFEELAKQSEEHERFLVEMINQTRQNADARVSQISSELESVKQELVYQQQLRVQIERKHNEVLEQMQEELAVLRREKKHAESEIATAKQHLLEFETIIQELKRQIEDLNEQLVQRSEELNRANTSIATLTQQNETLQNEIIQNRRDYQQQLDQMYAKEIELTNKLEHLQTENAGLLASLNNEKSIAENLQSQLATLTIQLDTLKKENASLNETNLDLQKKYVMRESALKKELEAKRLAEIAANKEIESLISEKKSLETELRRANQTIESLQSQIDNIQASSAVAVQKMSETSSREKELEEKCKKLEMKIQTMVDREQVLSEDIKRLEVERDDAISRVSTVTEQARAESTRYLNLGKSLLEHVVRLDDEASKFVRLIVSFREQYQKLLAHLSCVSEQALSQVTVDVQSESKISELLAEIAYLKEALSKKEKIEQMSVPLQEIRDAFHTTLKRYHLVTVTGALVCCFLIAGMVLLRIKTSTSSEHHVEKSYQSVSSFLIEKKEDSQVTVSHVSPATQVEVKPSTAEKTPEPLPLLVVNPFANLSIPGAKISETQDGCSIIFEQGLFSSLTNISVAGRQLLDSASEAIQPFLGEYLLQIEGYSDSIPLSDKAPFQNNQELALARANTICRLFVEKYHFELDSMKAIAGNLDSPPFSNDDPISRKKNRTVVLKLIKREKENKITR